jgi:hypothetical protein
MGSGLTAAAPGRTLKLVGLPNPRDRIAVDVTEAAAAAGTEPVSWGLAIIPVVGELPNRGIDAVRTLGDSADASEVALSSSIWDCDDGDTSGDIPTPTADATTCRMMPLFIPNHYELSQSIKASPMIRQLKKDWFVAQLSIWAPIRLE